jgi:hypothetical protein
LNNLPIVEEMHVIERRQLVHIVVCNPTGNWSLSEVKPEENDELNRKNQTS